jgi:hypothetical protein
VREPPKTGGRPGRPAIAHLVIQGQQVDRRPPVRVQDCGELRPSLEDRQQARRQEVPKAGGWPEHPAIAHLVILGQRVDRRPRFRGELPPSLAGRPPARRRCHSWMVRRQKKPQLRPKTTARKGRLKAVLAARRERRWRSPTMSQFLSRPALHSPPMLADRCSSQPLGWSSLIQLHGYLSPHSLAAIHRFGLVALDPLPAAPKVRRGAAWYSHRLRHLVRPEPEPWLFPTDPGFSPAPACLVKRWPSPAPPDAGRPMSLPLGGELHARLARTQEVRSLLC